MTSGAMLKATHTYTDADVAPGKLDIVVVPGPDPSSEFDEGALKWLRDQSNVEGLGCLEYLHGVVCLCGGRHRRWEEGKRAEGDAGAPGREVSQGEVGRG